MSRPLSALKVRPWASNSLTTRSESLLLGLESVPSRKSTTGNSFKTPRTMSTMGTKCSRPQLRGRPTPGPSIGRGAAVVRQLQHAAVAIGHRPAAHLDRIPTVTSIHALKLSGGFSFITRRTARCVARLLRTSLIRDLVTTYKPVYPVYSMLVLYQYMILLCFLSMISLYVIVYSYRSLCICRQSSRLMGHKIESKRRFEGPQQ